MRKHDLYSAALAKARSLVAHGYREPIAIEDCARAVGIGRVEPRQLHADTDGYLGELPDGTVVLRFRDDLPGTRRRFTIAHEVAHFLIARERAGEGEPPQLDGDRSNPIEERASNRIAAELLMPESRFVRALEARPVSWRSIVQLGAMFVVSQEAVAYRILEVPHVRAIFLKIDVQGGRCSCRSSQLERVALARNLYAEARDLLAQASGSINHRIGVVTPAGLESINAAGTHRIVQKAMGTTSEYWVLAWQSIRGASGRVALAGTRAARAECSAHFNAFNTYAKRGRACDRAGA